MKSIVLIKNKYVNVYIGDYFYKTKLDSSPSE